MEGEAIPFTAEGRRICNFAANVAEVYLPNIKVARVPRGKNADYAAMFDELRDIKPKLVLSFLCPAIIPTWILEKSPLNVNFHPGNADYPGIGGFSFALYEGAANYGVACHHMEAAVDTGKIIYEENFPVDATDTPESLQLKAWAALLEVYSRFLRTYGSGETDFSSNLKDWNRKPFTRKDIDKLSQIDLQMSEQEILKRLRATSYPGFPPKLLVGGKRFEISPEGEGTEPPLAERAFD